MNERLTMERRPTLRAQVCLLLEGTYPYVAGGVSSWVHDIISNLPELSFALLHIGAQRGTYGPARYTLPANVAELSELYCQPGPASGPVDLATREELERQIRGLRRRRGPPYASRTLAALRRMHLDDRVDDALLADLAQADLSVPDGYKQVLEHALTVSTGGAPITLICEEETFLLW